MHVFAYMQLCRLLWNEFFTAPADCGQSVVGKTRLLLMLALLGIFSGEHWPAIEIVDVFILHMQSDMLCEVWFVSLRGPPPPDHQRQPLYAFLIFFSILPPLCCRSLFASKT